MKRSLLSFFSLLFFAVAADQTISPALAADAASLPHYGTPPNTISGELRSIGSDSMDSLISAWTDEYRKIQPGVNLRVESRGSASAPSALLDGTANLGPMARPMKGREVSAFRAKLGVEPVQVRSAVAAIGIYVSRDNPLKRISLAELDAVFSDTRNRGEKRVLKTWAELGITEALGRAEIVPIGRSSDGYAYAYFRQQVLALGDFRPGLDVTSDTASTLEAVAANPNSIGFGEIVSGGDRVKLVAVSRESGDPAVIPSPEEIVSERYPLSRFLSFYFVQLPGEPVDRVTKDFLSFVLGVEGQTIVREEGLLPLPERIAREELAKLPKE
jgi:phosphate transport system substrate-binding protein